MFITTLCEKYEISIFNFWVLFPSPISSNLCMINRKSTKSWSIFKSPEFLSLLCLILLLHDKTKAVLNYISSHLLHDTFCSVAALKLYFFVESLDIVNKGYITWASYYIFQQKMIYNQTFLLYPTYFKVSVFRLFIVQRIRSYQWFKFSQLHTTSSSAQQFLSWQLLAQLKNSFSSSGALVSIRPTSAFRSGGY